MALILVYVTNPDMKTAKKISSYLLNKRLVACSNIMPITSSYWWKGKIENSKEYACILKTRASNWEKLKKEIKKIHPYKTPCIIRIKAEANQEFQRWALQETKN